MKILKLVLPAILFMSATAWGGQTLVIFSGRHAKFVKPVIASFTKKTGIKVKLFNSKSTALINRLSLEGNKTEADLFISNDAGSLQIGSDKGLFTPVNKKTAKLISNKYRAKNNAWVGLSARARVLVVSTAHTNNLKYVRSVFDLADPRLLGKIAVTHSANGSFIAGISIYQKSVGDAKTMAFLKGIKTNSAGKVYNKHSKIVADVAKGKKIIGLVNHYYIYRYLDKNPDAKIAIRLPDQGEKDMGVAWNVAGIAISKYSKKQKAAQRLVAYLLSKEGQEQFARVNREYPVRAGVATAKPVPPVHTYKVSTVPMYEIGKSRNKTLSLIEKVGLY